MGELLIGTSGYDYNEWKGGFYPENLAKAKFLEYYASQFNSLELNGTYYRMPGPQQMHNMIDRSGGKVKFTVKAFSGLTHTIDERIYRQVVLEFKKAIEPLFYRNLLLCVLFQFPESFRYEKHERIYLDSLLKEVSDIPVVVEMRNTKWQNDQVYNALRQRKVGWCIADSPLTMQDIGYTGHMKLDYVITGDIAYLRFHGRNAEMWYKGDNVTRYDYLYSDAELQMFVEPIKHLLQNTKIVQLFFNNHAKAQAAINARKIEMLLNNEKYAKSL
ncbi:MAG: DUF72 domain-containing protein [Treponema sp.]|nr:DUF72 domain-containing protein [Treponema sp.]